MRRSLSQPLISDFLNQQPPKRHKIVVEIEEEAPQLPELPPPPDEQPQPSQIIPPSPEIPLPPLPSEKFFSKYVFLPNNPRNLFLESETGVYRPRWPLIASSLAKPIHDCNELEAAIMIYNPEWVGEWNFGGLRSFFAAYASDRERDRFFSKTLPHILHLALRIVEIGPKIPLLRTSCPFTVNLTQPEIAILLANAFLCTFPYRNSPTSFYRKFPSINFWTLFQPQDGGCSPKQAGKLRCFFHYFHRLSESEHNGIVSFHREVGKVRPDFRETSAALSCFFPQSAGSIEDSSGHLQVDFANKLIGGGVLHTGAVQEEIRFAICPELVVSRLFCAELASYECLIVTGPERFSDYSGYAKTFSWAGDHIDRTPFDKHNRRLTRLVAMDATSFFRPETQFEERFIYRETYKAWVSFQTTESPAQPIATGNWGCGAFKGDPQLKAMIQLIAASLHNRDVVYFTFGNDAQAAELTEIYAHLQVNEMTSSQLFDALLRYGALRKENPNATSLFEWLLTPSEQII